MTGAEKGFLLLTSHLGNPERKPLTVPQFRMLAQRAAQMEKPVESRALTESDLLAIGCDRTMAHRILRLLQEEEVLSLYLQKGKRLGCVPVTRMNPRYPLQVRNRLGLDAPGVLWLRGEISLLSGPMISLVGSRELRKTNRDFAEMAGCQAARQGITLVSGNARGADQTAQNACLEAGGTVISVVADSLQSHKVRKNILFVSEDCFDGAFTVQRALSRNRIIHCMGEKTLVAQASVHRGGTWDGTVKNLQNRWSDVYCFADGTGAAVELCQLGATGITCDQLWDFSSLQPDYTSLF